MKLKMAHDRLKAGDTVFAAWIAINDPLSVEVMGGAGYDALILDAQHGGVTWDRMGQLLQAADLSKTTSFVRVPWNSPDRIMRALDLGAAGVIVPMVSTARQAQQACEAMHYPPAGIRSFGMVRNYYGPEGATADPLCFVMIETAEAMANLDAIASVPGVHGLFVGPVDLALSLGLGPVLEVHETVLENIDKVVAACRRHNKISGSAAIGLPYARALLERGVQFIAQGSDVAFLRRCAAMELEQLHVWRSERQARATT